MTSPQARQLLDLLDGFEMTKSQHDWLERRFENMTVKESLLFRGAMQIERPQMACDVMLIANQLDHYDLFYGAGDDVQLGKFIMEQIQRPSDQAREFLDPEKVGAAYRQKGGNTFCDGHFIKVTSLIDPFLDGDPSMNPDKGDYGIRVKLASRTNMDGVWVGFPDTGEYMDTAHPDELLLALDALEVESVTECIAVDVDCCLPQLKDILAAGKKPVTTWTLDEVGGLSSACVETVSVKAPGNVERKKVVYESGSAENVGELAANIRASL